MKISLFIFYSFVVLIFYCRPASAQYVEYAENPGRKTAFDVLNAAGERFCILGIQRDSYLRAQMIRLGVSTSEYCGCVGEESAVNMEANALSGILVRHLVNGFYRENGHVQPFADDDISWVFEAYSEYLSSARQNCLYRQRPDLY